MNCVHGRRESRPIALRNLPKYPRDVGHGAFALHCGNPRSSDVRRLLEPPLLLVRAGWYLCRHRGSSHAPGPPKGPAGAFSLLGVVSTPPPPGREARERELAAPPGPCQDGPRTSRDGCIDYDGGLRDWHGGSVCACEFVPPPLDLHRLRDEVAAYPSRHLLEPQARF